MPQDNAYTRLQLFFQAKLQPDDIAEAETLLDELQAELQPGQPQVQMAGDARLGRSQRLHAEQSGFAKRFPQAARIRSL